MYQTRQQRIWNKVANTTPNKIKPRASDVSSAKRVLDRLKAAIEVKEVKQCQMIY